MELNDLDEFELGILARNHPDEEVRKDAGENLVNRRCAIGRPKVFYNPDGSPDKKIDIRYFSIFKLGRLMAMANDSTLHESTREYAITNLPNTLEDLGYRIRKVGAVTAVTLAGILVLEVLAIVGHAGYRVVKGLVDKYNEPSAICSREAGKDKEEMGISRYNTITYTDKDGMEHEVIASALLCWYKEGVGTVVSNDSLGPGSKEQSEFRIQALMKDEVQEKARREEKTRGYLEIWEKMDHSAGKMRTLIEEIKGNLGTDVKNPNNPRINAAPQNANHRLALNEMNDATAKMRQFTKRAERRSVPKQLHRARNRI
jgi:hypothetical protein